ncbi:MAG: hypothetical protein VX697_02285 [Pseudomonadota bacterium]|jgi:acyl dehydratase|nr:hypothetical protein [Pseudomonadota bacterium]|tara:strand:- start:599 stop:1372 length:774 start_codon:yes stop_codon:yes gene_type:complete
MSTHTSIARNFSEESENRMHSDVEAQQYGFSGALVPGVAVFGHMTYPLVKQLGESWLNDYWTSIRLAKPAYHNDHLTINHEQEGDRHTVRCTARDDLLIAEMVSSPNDREVDPIATATSGQESGGRSEIEWNDIHIGEAFPSWHWDPTQAENDAYALEVDDTLPLYAKGVVHPHAILSMANQSFSRRYVLPAWLHVGSEISFRKILHLGDTVEIRTVPVEKWKKKGHEFVDLYLSYLVDGEVAVEIKHTSIYKIATT